jgi:ribose transport system permease protein
MLKTNKDSMMPGTGKNVETGKLLHFIKSVGLEILVFITTIVIFILCAIFINGFLTMGNMSTLVRSVSVLGILGVGMGVVVIGRGLDLSQVAVMAIFAGWTLKLVGLGYGLIVSIGASLGLSVLIGIFNGFSISIIGIPALFTTLASGFFVYGVGRWLMLNGAVIVQVPDGQDFLIFLGQGEIFHIPVPLVMFAVIALIGYFLLSRTTAGRFTYALGDNAEAARLTGVSVRVLTIEHYAFAAFVAYLAGIAMAGSAALINTRIFSSSLIFDVLLVVVLGGISLSGGRGSIVSVLVGTLLVGTLVNGMILLNIQNEWQNIAKSVVLLIAITLDRKLHPRDEETARQGDL